MSCPRKTINSNCSSLGGIYFSTSLSSVPNERTAKKEKNTAIKYHFCGRIPNICKQKARKSNEPFANVTVAFLVSMAYKIPSYLISDLEIRLIFVPMYGVPEFISRNDTNNRKNIRMAQDGQDY